mmetsp:Transcript_164/g.417  ORF Transcript_164/g.417 Transcript_164/m.417 type:complete len:422 (-) Transcript_164:303-1568(-)|eukprot:CAMPEP_0118925872 /NCGR_PEP_ID=MMETSP1169-20130426/3686_1 /TAXON_ID=36882 /ORGANISM="Pyramimonas obovata, Strain CCMP722" /LENGTH=421 /DNA_ID=CAMNT_0006867293 /DNA_START=262 /DNA_END=1527 /DNA_ORIENTATION=-
MDPLGLEVDLECNSPLDLDAEDPEPVSNVDEHNENEILNSTELVYLSKAGNEGLLTEELQSWVERENVFRCPYSCYLHAQAGARKLRSRGRAVRWILKTQQTHDLSAVTASLAVNYVDRMLNLLSAKDLDNFRLDVLPVACLSIACKMDERFEYTPEELQMFSPPFSIISSQTVNQMEEKVLLTLDWRMCSLVPVSFVNHVLCMLIPFSSTHCPSEDPCLSTEADALDRWLEMLKHVWERTCRYLLLCLADVELLTFRPSELAVTAVVEALGPERVSASAMQRVLAALNTSSARIESCGEDLQRVLSMSQQHDSPSQTEMHLVPSTPEKTIPLPRRAAVSPASKENPAISTPGRSLNWDAHVLQDLNAEISRGATKRDFSAGATAEDEFAHKGDQAIDWGADGAAFRRSDTDGHVAKMARR